MNIRKFYLIFIIIFLIFLIPGFSDEKISDKKILLINAYDSSYVWTEEEVRGVTETLDSSFENYSLKIEYMDTKDYTSENYYSKILEIYKIKYEYIDFDAVIVTDDNAFRLILDNREELFKETPLFVAGINSINGYNLEKEKNIYGFVEKTSPIETLNCALNVNKNIDKVYIVIGYSVTAEQVLYDIKEQFISLPKNIEVEYIREKNLGEIEEYISGINEENSIIIMPFFKVDLDGKVYNNAETTRRISEASNIMLYGLNSYQIPHGIIGGELVDAYYHGKGVVDLMVQYFNNKLSENIVIKDKKANVYKFDYNEMTRFGVKMNMLPKGSIVVNKPESFIEKYSNVILLSSIILVSLSLYIFILIKQVNKKTAETKLYLKEIISAKERMIELEKIAGLGEIVVSIAHEINTPLGSVMTAILFLENNLQKIIKHKDHKSFKIMDVEKIIETSVELFEIIKENLNIMKSIVDDFKKLNSELDIEVKMVNVRENIEHLIILNSHEFEANNISVKFDCDERLIMKTDKKLITSIFNELIINSINHGFQSVENRVIYISVKDEDKNMEIIYSDNGVGIKNEMVKEIFNPFYSNDKSKYRGLGLYRVYNVINLLGGSIEYIGSTRGATFKINFPKKS